MKKYIIVFCVAVLTACQDFLEPKSQSEYMPKEASALNEMLLGSAYILVGGYTSYPFSASMQIFDDDVCCTGANGIVSTSDEKKFRGYRALYTWQPDMFDQMQEAGEFKNVWETHYKLILGANAALDYVNDVTGSTDEKNLVRAQAYALRGFYYFNLVNYFGEPYNYNKEALGVPLKLTSDYEDAYIPQSTVNEVYKQVVSDLNEAERLYLLLPKSMQYKKDFRTSLPMVQLLKSRVYLYMENWKEAAKYANKVIKDWDFTLKDLNEVPAASSYNFISQDCSETIWLFGRLDDYGYGFTGLSISYSYKLFVASQALLDGFVAGDLRKDRYMSQDKGTYLAWGKFALSSYGGNVSSEKLFSQAFRLSEAYLNLAEAAFMDKDEATALWAYKQLREKRFTPETNKKVTTLTLDDVRQERRLELCFEMHRWFDLRRYGMPSFTRTWKTGGESTSYTLEEKDPSYTLPIPTVVMNKNRLLLQNKLAQPRTGK